MNTSKKNIKIDVSPQEILENYEVNFQAIFTDKNVQKLYYAFLKTEYEEGSFDFLLEVNKMTNQKKKTAENIARALSIKETFLDVGSPKELNLDFKSRDSILQLFEMAEQQKDLKKWKFQVGPTELFTSIFKQIFLQMVFEKKSRFIRTTEFMDYASKNLLNEDLLIKREIKVFNFTNEDFYFPAITEKDKELFSTLVADNYDWSFIYQKNGCLTYCGEKKDYLPNVSFFNIQEAICSIWEWTVPYPLEDVVRVLFHDNQAFRKNSPSVTHFDIITTLNADEQMTVLKNNNIQEEVKNDGIIVSETHIVTPGAMKNMKAYGSSTLYLEGNDIVYLWKSCKSFKPDEEILKIHKGEFYTKKGKKKENEEYVVPMINGCYRHSKIGNNLTKVVCTGFQNYGIKDSNLDIVKFSKKMFEARCGSLRPTLIQEIKEELPNMKNWEYNDMMGKMCLKVLEEYKQLNL